MDNRNKTESIDSIGLLVYITFIIFAIFLIMTAEYVLLLVLPSLNVTWLELFGFRIKASLAALFTVVVLGALWRD